MKLTPFISKIVLAALGLSIAIPTQAAFCADSFRVASLTQQRFAIANRQTETSNPVVQNAQLKQKSTLVALAAKSQSTKKTVLALQNSQQRWIEVDLSEQRLIAWEGKKRIYRMTVSTGKRSTPTPTGTFNIQTKLTTARMQGDDYDLPDVPYVMYYEGSYGIHGAYWHNNFGTPVSHGCVNVAPKQARLLYNWAKVGTPVVVHE